MFVKVAQKQQTVENYLIVAMTYKTNISVLEIELHSLSAKVENATVWSKTRLPSASKYGRLAYFTYLICNQVNTSSSFD